MKNVVFHITIPAGLKLVAGNRLMKDITFDFISRLEPYFSSVDYVRLDGGPTISKLSDITIACQIYKASCQAKLVTPIRTPMFGPEHERLIGSRVQYVTALATRDLILNFTTLMGPNAHVLANLSVERKADNTKKVAQLNDDIKKYEVVLRSHGRVSPGGRPEFHMGAKGVMDWSERTPSRTWFSNGMGANATSMDPGSNTGGRGKPVKFFASPMHSPPHSALRIGVYQPGYPLAQFFPYPMGY